MWSRFRTQDGPKDQTSHPPTLARQDAPCPQAIPQRTLTLNVAGINPTARVERAHSYRPRSASRRTARRPTLFFASCYDCSTGSTKSIPLVSASKVILTSPSTRLLMTGNSSEVDVSEIPVNLGDSSSIGRRGCSDSPSSLNSRNGGSWLKSCNPKCSRKNLVVPYMIGRPGTSFRPTIRTSLRSHNVRRTPDVSTPRISSISDRTSGCLYAIIARDSSAERESFCAALALSIRFSHGPYSCFVTSRYPPATCTS